jgi:hypothetical protein
VKNALPSSCLPNFLLHWVDVHSDLCVYTPLQVAKFSESHLQAGGWYLDCSFGFVPPEEKPLFSSLVSSAPDEINVPFEEPDLVELPPPPPKAPKGKGRAKNAAIQATSHLPTRSAAKTPLHKPNVLQSPSSTPSIAPSLAPSITPSASRPPTIATPSHSGTSLLSLPRKRKAALLDTTATSSEAPKTLSLIENVDMVQLMLDSEVAGGPLPAYSRIQEFIAKVCIFPLPHFPNDFLFGFICYSSSSWFLMKFLLQVGAGRSRVNTSTTSHKGLDLLFADIPENLPVPNISTDVPAWNMLHDSYYECLFAFAKSNLYDHGVLVLAHCASNTVSRSILDWAHTYDFYVAEDWFGMNDLDLQSPFNPSGVVSKSPSLPLAYSFHFNFNSISFQFRIRCFRLGSSASRFFFVLTPFLECGRRPCKRMVTTSSEMAG